MKIGDEVLFKYKDCRDGDYIKAVVEDFDKDSVVLRDIYFAFSKNYKKKEIELFVKKW